MLYSFVKIMLAVGCRGAAKETERAKQQLPSDPGEDHDGIREGAVRECGAQRAHRALWEGAGLTRKACTNPKTPRRSLKKRKKKVAGKGSKASCHTPSSAQLWAGRAGLSMSQL